MKKSSRRSFIKSMLAVPLVSSGFSPLLATADKVSTKSGHKFKISLNAYSFNKVLKEGKIDLFDLLAFRLNSRI